MRNIPRAFEILVYFIQQSKMDHVKEMCYIFQLFAERIFVYLRSIILQEFTSFMPDSNNFDDWGYKNGELTFSKQTIADFVAFFVVCALFGIFIVISAKYWKEEEEEENCYHPPPDNRPPLVDLTEEDERDSLYDLPNLSRPWGDAASGPEKFLPPRYRLQQRKLKPYCITADYDSSRHSGISIKTTQSHHSQSTQTSSRMSTRMSCNQSWLVRKTRSGQIYGKYPM